MARCLAVAALGLALAGGAEMSACAGKGGRSGDARAATSADAGDASPEDAAAHRRRAIALHTAGRLDEAVEQFERAAELNPSTRGLLDLALAYGSVSRNVEAETTYRRLLESEPGHAIALHNLGNIAVKRGQLDQAIELYHKAIRARPGYLLALSHLADALKQAGRLREAYQTFARVLELEPSTAVEAKAFNDALYQMASLDITMGAHERAERLLSELLQSDPEHESAHYARGHVLTMLGRPEEAQREFEAHMQLLEAREPTGPVAMDR